MEKRLLDFIEEERKETFKQLRELYRLPIEERVERGECITDLRLLQRNEEAVLFEVEDNLSRFRTGDLVYLGDGINVEDGLKCVFTNYDPVNKLLRLTLESPRSYWESELTQGKAYVLDKREMDTFPLRTEAVKMAFSQDDFSYAGRVISLKEKPLRIASPENAKKLLPELGLDSSQEKAFLTAYTTSPALIQGPPGTGKTLLLAKLAKFLAEEDRCKVLICCFTHRSINNALNKVVSLGFDRVFKISKPYYVDDLDDSIQWEEKWHDLHLPPYTSSYILGATPYAAFNVAGKLSFDAVIFDEAGQLTLDLALMGMICAERLIFIGDHQQMAPVLVANHKDELVRRSVFEHLMQAYPATMLELTYRMNQELCHFPSKYFYQGRLQPTEKARGRTLSLGGSEAFSDILDPQKPSVFVEINHWGKKMRSPEEAKLVAHLVLELVSSHRIAPEEIAVITPFRAQAREIRVKLAHLARKKGVSIGDELVVDTVERIQGQEREVVIISFASSNPVYLESMVEFYFKPNRLNVSITRARVKRIMVGSKRILEIRPSGKAEREMVKVFCDLFQMTPRLDYTEKVGELE